MHSVTVIDDDQLPYLLNGPVATTVPAPAATIHVMQAAPTSSPGWISDGVDVARV